MSYCHIRLVDGSQHPSPDTASNLQHDFTTYLERDLDEEHFSDRGPTVFVGFPVMLDMLRRRTGLLNGFHLEKLSNGVLNGADINVTYMIPRATCLGQSKIIQNDGLLILR